VIDTLALQYLEDMRENIVFDNRLVFRVEKNRYGNTPTSLSGYAPFRTVVDE
jgi:hypothetical protein